MVKETEQWLEEHLKSKEDSETSGESFEGKKRSLEQRLNEMKKEYQASQNNRV